MKYVELHNVYEEKDKGVITSDDLESSKQCIEAEKKSEKKNVMG